MSAQPDVLVVGGGFAGRYAVHRFRELGFSVKAFEAGSNVGGTWYWNRYPGARCDVPSLEYSYGFSPELEQEWDWLEVFSAQEDILRCANHVADKFDLRRDMQFNTRIVGVEWQDSTRRWRLTSEAGENLEAPFCVMATGCLSVPVEPKIPGAERSRGEVYHTGRRPHESVDLGGNRVGVIGTGSSGVQAIPELARQCAHLTVFQRTEVYTVPANRKRMRDAVPQEFRDHYRQIREMQQKNAGGISNFRPRKSRRPGDGVAADVTAPTDSVSSSDAAVPNELLDLTTEQRRAVMDRFGLVALLAFRDVCTNAEANETANELYCDTVRSMVRDPETAEHLLPKTYGLGCKRQVLDLDVLIYATGFDAMTGALLRANIRGRGGRRLNDQWRDGPVTYLGLQIAGFPNLFAVTGPGSPSVLSNMIVAIEQHVNWIGACIVAKGTMYTSPSCNSWYLGANIPGKPRIFMPYVGGYPRYRERYEHEAVAGYPGFRVERAGSTT